MPNYKKVDCPSKSFPDLRDTDLHDTQKECGIDLQEWTKAFVLYAIHLALVICASIGLYLLGFLDKSVGLDLGWGVVLVVMWFAALVLVYVHKELTCKLGSKIFAFLGFTSYTIYLIYLFVNKDEYSALNICIVLTPFVLGTLVSLVSLGLRKDRNSFDTLIPTLIFGGLSMTITAISYWVLSKDDDWVSKYIFRIGILHFGAFFGYLMFMLSLSNSASRNEIFRKMQKG